MCGKEEDKIISWRWQFLHGGDRGEDAAQQRLKLLTFLPLSLLTTPYFDHPCPPSLNSVAYVRKVRTLHSRANVFRFDENITFVKRELLPELEQIRDVKAAVLGAAWRDNFKVRSSSCSFNFKIASLSKFFFNAAGLAGGWHLQSPRSFFSFFSFPLTFLKADGELHLWLPRPHHRHPRRAAAVSTPVSARVAEEDVLGGDQSVLGRHRAHDV
jgi:hypothetical protein